MVAVMFGQFINHGLKLKEIVNLNEIEGLQHIHTYFYIKVLFYVINFIFEPLKLYLFRL
jgi:hypothetical protein